MANPLPPPRIYRRRQTRPVISHLEGCKRWWRGGANSGLPLRRTMRFKSGDPFERLGWLRNFVVTLSLATPAILLFTIHQTQIANWLRDWSSNPLAKAQRYLESGRIVDALVPLQVACEGAPQNAEVLRALATAAMDVAPAEARRCFHKLEQLGLSTPEDRALHATLLAKLHDFRGAKAVLASVSQASAVKPAVQRAWLTIWRESGDFGAAAGVLDKLVTASPDEVDTILDLAASAAASKAVSPDVLNRIQQHLAAGMARWLATGKGAMALSRAQRVASMPFASPNCREQIAKIFRELPGHPVEFRVAAVRLGFPNTLSAEDEQVLHRAYHEEIDREGGISAEAKDRIAAYLQQQGDHQFVTELIAQEESVTEPELYRRRLASLLELGRWREAGAMAADETAPPVPHSRAMLRALAALQGSSGPAFLAEHLLVDALTGAREERRSVDCFTTGYAALDNYLPELAATAFSSALDFSSDRPSMIGAIMRNTRGKNISLSMLLNAFESGASLRDESIQNQLIYLSLLAGKKVDAMHSIIVARRAQVPGDVYLRFLESFALHQTGAYTQAARLLVPLPRYRWHQGEVAVISSIMASSGNIESCRALLSQIDASLLFQEEKSLCEPWQIRAAADSHLMSSAVTSTQR